MERLDFALEGQADQAKLELQFMDTVNNFARLYPPKIPIPHSRPGVGTDREQDRC